MPKETGGFAPNGPSGVADLEDALRAPGPDDEDEHSEKLEARDAARDDEDRQEPGKLTPAQEAELKEDAAWDKSYAETGQETLQKRNALLATKEGRALTPVEERELAELTKQLQTHWPELLVA